MSIRKVLLLTTLLLSFSIVSAQENKPKFIGEVAILNEDGTLTNIEPEFSQLTMFMVMTVKGIESDMRIKQSDEIKFIVRVENTKVSPLKTITVLKLKKTKEKREVGVSSLIDEIEGSVKFLYDVYDEDFILVTLKDLPQGEYLISYGTPSERNYVGSHLVATFGID